MPISKEEFDKLRPLPYVHKSHLTFWLNCPYAYKLICIDKKPTVTTISMDSGTQFHQFAAKFFDQVDIEELRQYDDPSRLLLKLIPMDMPIIIRKMCENFVRFESRRFALFRKHKLEYMWKPIATEISLKSDKLYIEGTIDRIDFFNDVDLAVGEYKTGTYENIVDLRRELAIYAMLVNEHYDGRCKWIFRYNPRVDDFWIEKLKDATVNAVKKQIAKFRSAIALNEFPPKISDRCLYCNVIEYCEYADRWDYENSSNSFGRNG